MFFRYKVEADADRKKRIEQCILYLYQSNIDSLLSNEKVLLPPPNKILAEGEYELGEIVYDDKVVCKFGLREKEFLRHVGLFGITGTGKSNVVFKLIDEFLRHKKKIFVFDWKKQYRDYLSYNKTADVLIFGVGNRYIPTFQFNPLIPPPGLEPFQYIEFVTQIVASSYFVGEGVISLLRKAINELYKQFGVYDGTVTKYPTFQDILNFINQTEKKGRSKEWQDSAIRSLEAICHGGIGQIVNVQSPTMHLSEILNHNVFLELGDLGQSQKSFIIQSLLTYLYYYSMNRGVREKLMNIIIIEEAHHILRDHSKSTVKEPITDVVLKEIREFGTGVIIIDQNPSMISVPALANNYCSVGMYTKHGSDISALSRAMFLSESEKECLGKLRTGHGIVKLAGRIFTPFLVKFPLMPIKKGVILDLEIELRMEKRGFSRYSSAKQPPLTNQEPLRTYSDFDINKKDFVENPIRGVELPDTHPAPQESEPIIKKLLKDIHNHPFDGISARSKRLLISNRKLTDLVASLASKNSLKKVMIKDKSGQRCLLEIIEPNIESNRNGGIEHRYWNHSIAEINKKNGFKVELEKHIKEVGFIDQIISKNKKSIAIEIETGKSHPIETIIRNLASDMFDEIYCVATTPEVLLDIKMSFEKSDIKHKDKVKFCLAQDYS